MPSVTTLYPTVNGGETDLPSGSQFMRKPVYDTNEDGLIDLAAGGTGASTSAGARDYLDVAQSTWTQTGTGAAARTVHAKLRDPALYEADFTLSADLSNAAMAKTASEYAFERRFYGPDLSIQFRVTYTPGAVGEWRVAGGTATAGCVMYAWSESAANYDGTIAAKGTGGVYFVNGQGIIGAALDNGTGIASDGYAALLGGTSGYSPAVVARSVSGVSNVGLALSPLGTGALTRSIPDGTATGGIARGAYAVDWSATRSVSTTVAQAQYSVIGGGSDNEISSAATHATIAGGNFNALAALRSWCPGGTLASDRSRTATGVWSAGQFATRGDAQVAEGVIRAQTTNATPGRLVADSSGVANSANTFNLPNNGLYLVTLMLSARQSSGTSGSAGDSSWRLASIAVKRGASAATTALVGTVATLSSGSDAAAAAWTWSITADTTNGGINISFTGEANKTIKTVCRIMSVEVVG